MARCRRNLSLDLKARIPVLKKNGYSVEEICAILGIKKTTVYDTLAHQDNFNVPFNLHREGSIRGRLRILNSTDLSFIRSLIHCNGMLYLDEIQALLLDRRGVSVSIPTLSRTLQRMQYSKKRVSARAIERNEARRAAYLAMIAELAPDPEMLMFTDESAKDERTSSRSMGWSGIGGRCVSRRVFVRGKRFSILPLLSLDGIITYDVIEGSVTADKFLSFIRNMVIPLTNPYPGPRSVLVLDNCSIHHTEELRHLVEDQALCKLVYLPPYSPDFNPIEQGFSSIKSSLRRNQDKNSLYAIDEACQKVTAEHARNYYIASGYM